MGLKSKMLFIRVEDRKVVLTNDPGLRHNLNENDIDVNYNDDIHEHLRARLDLPSIRPSGDYEVQFWIILIHTCKQVRRDRKLGR